MTMTARNGSAERRRYPRANFTWRAAVGFRDEQDLLPATTKNISLCGVCLHASLAALPGDEVLVLLSLKDRTVPALATVVRSENLDENTIELRLDFNWVSDFSKQQLARLTRAAGESGNAEPPTQGDDPPDD